MPNFNGMWTSRQQLQARGASLWPTPPGAPTSVSATAGNAQATVSFTAPTDVGYPGSITQYTVTSSPGGITATGSSSPIVVTGLTNGTAYTFTVRATNSTGAGIASSPSNSVTPTAPPQVAYTTPGTYSWVAPAGVTSVSVVAVGAGGGNTNYKFAGGGAGLGYKNNYSVTPGSSYTVFVGAGASGAGQDSYFINTSVVRGGGGQPSSGGTYTGDGGGNGGSPGSGFGAGGGGAGGYSGNGGNGGTGGSRWGAGSSGSGGGGGGGAGSDWEGGGGGGVGILGQGSSGSGSNSGVAPGSFGYGYGGQGGSGGTYASANTTANAFGGSYGGGAGDTRAGADGAVRIIWPGTTRQFPSTNTGDL